LLLASCEPQKGVIDSPYFIIAVYPNATETQRVAGASRAGDVSNSTNDVDAVTWRLTTSDPVKKVIEFYENKYPNEVNEAQAKEGYDGTFLQFAIRPDDGGPNDMVQFSIIQEQIIIVQVRLAK